MSDIEVHSTTESEYSNKYRDHVFEQYKLYLDMADKISSRRHSANTFFVSINTVLITLAGYAKASTDVESFFYLVTSMAGVLICYVWYRLVLSYKNLNSAKFKVVCSVPNYDHTISQIMGHKIRLIDDSFATLSS